MLFKTNSETKSRKIRITFLIKANPTSRRGLRIFLDIGDILSEWIIQYRRNIIGSLKELDNSIGIKSKTIDKIKEKIVLWIKRGFLCY